MVARGGAHAEGVAQPLDAKRKKNEAPKGRQKPTQSEQVFLIELDAVLLQEPPELIPKRHLLVVLGLVGDSLSNCWRASISITRPRWLAGFSFRSSQM